MISDLMKEKAFQDLNIGLHVVGKFLFKLETSEQIKWKILMKWTDQLLWELSNFYNLAWPLSMKK